MNRYLILLLCVAISACSNRPYSVLSSDIQVDTGATIYIVSHGWHTGFVMPSAEIYKHLPELERRFGQTPYLEFGWGDRGFYQANQITSGLSLRAIFWPTESVMHVVAVDEHPQHYFSGSEMHSFCLNKQHYAQLIDFIRQSFLLNNNDVSTLKAGLYGDSQFYKGAGDYYLFNTCNKWTARGLESAGFDIVPVLKLTAGSIMSYLEATIDSNTTAQCN